MNLYCTFGQKSKRGWIKRLGALSFVLIKTVCGEQLMLGIRWRPFVILMTFIALPIFNEDTQKQMEHLLVMLLSGWLVGITFVTGWISGSYPAVLSLSNLKFKRQLNTTRSYLVSPNDISVCSFYGYSLLAQSWFQNKVNFIQTRNLGYDREDLDFTSHKNWSK